MVKRSGIAAALWMISATCTADVLVGSWSTNDVRRYDLNGNFLGVFVGAGAGGLTVPDGFAYAPDGSLLVSDSNNERVLQYDGQTGAFQGTFISQGLTRAGYCAFGPDGNFYVCSSTSNSVERYDGKTRAHIGTISGNGLLKPTGLLWRDGLLYVSGFGSGAIHRFDAVSGAPVDTIATTISQPLYMRLGAEGDLYISEYGASRVSQWDLTTLTRKSVINGNGLSGPVGQLALDDGSFLVTSWNNGRVLRFDQTSHAYLGDFAALGRPNDLILMPVPEPRSGVLLLMISAVFFRCR